MRGRLALPAQGPFPAAADRDAAVTVPRGDQADDAVEEAAPHAHEGALATRAAEAAAGRLAVPDGAFLDLRYRHVGNAQDCPQRRSRMPSGRQAIGASGASTRSGAVSPTDRYRRSTPGVPQECCS